jgi:hypothetical protein
VLSPFEQQSRTLEEVIKTWIQIAVSWVGMRGISHCICCSGKPFQNHGALLEWRLGSNLMGIKSVPRSPAATRLIEQSRRAYEYEYLLSKSVPGLMCKAECQGKQEKSLALIEPSSPNRNASKWD